MSFKKHFINYLVTTYFINYLHCRATVWIGGYTWHLYSEFYLPEWNSQLQCCWRFCQWTRLRAGCNWRCWTAAWGAGVCRFYPHRGVSLHPSSGCLQSSWTLLASRGWRTHWSPSSDVWSHWSPTREHASLLLTIVCFFVMFKIVAINVKFIVK